MSTENEPGSALRSEILELTRRFAAEVTRSRPFRPGMDPVPVSGKVLFPSDSEALVDASLGGWLTAGRFTDDFERERADFTSARFALMVMTVNRVGVAGGLPHQGPPRSLLGLA